MTSGRVAPMLCKPVSCIATEMSYSRNAAAVRVKWRRGVIVFQPIWKGSLCRLVDVGIEQSRRVAKPSV